MRKFLLFVLLPVNLLAQAKPIASYKISARYSPETKEVQGRERLTWLNDSGDAVPELRFHLYMNAFKNTKSTFVRESGGQLRGDRSRKDSWGWINVKSLKTAEGDNLTKGIQYIHPDDDNADDQTVIRVPLPQPVKPGASIQLDIEFTTKFPKVFARTGYQGDFVLGGQWFPKIGVYERMGMRYAQDQGQWNAHQFHANSEFYANFGTYEVDLTVPAAYVIGATGVERSRKENPDKTVTYRFYQENVHDFAWTAQPTFVRLEKTFSAETEVSPMELSEITRLLGVTHEEARLSDVKMILLLQPEHQAQAERHFRATAAAIKYFGLWYGRYPHATITVVDPPYHAGGAGGMEYPTFITAGTNWLVGANDGRPEEVIVHEFGHQFWQGMVASNEFEEAWMDEGFNTYSTGKVMDEAFGRIHAPINFFGIPIQRIMQTFTADSVEVDRLTYLVMPKADNLARNAWSYRESTSYGVNSYYRTGMMLNTLERLLGEQTMARVMRAYHQRWRFGHPAAPDFFKVVDEVSGKDLKWFFDQYVNGSNIIDYAIGDVESVAVTTKPGVYGDAADMKTLSTEDARKQDDKADSNQKKKVYRSRVTVLREGEATLPVEIVIKFDNGELERRQWDGQYRWIRYEFLKNAKVTSAEVDPEWKVPLDVNRSNNSYVEKTQFQEPVKLGSTFLFWVQQLLALVGSVA